MLLINKPMIWYPAYGWNICAGCIFCGRLGGPDEPEPAAPGYTELGDTTSPCIPPTMQLYGSTKKK